MIKLPDVTTLYVIISFAIAYAILKKYLFVPLGTILDERDHEEREAEALHAESLSRFQQAMADAEERLSLARREALKTREQLRAEGRGRLEQRLAEASAAASEAVDQASRELAEQSRALSAELPDKSRGLARVLAEKILGAEARRVIANLLAQGGILALMAEEASEHAGKVLGIPGWIWQLANLVAFLGLLVYFVARPVTEGFRKKQLEVEERLRQARERRAEAARFETEIRERMTRLEREIAEIRAQGLADGEVEKKALVTRADQEAERVRLESQAEIDRRLAFAREDLKQTAADLIASTAREQVRREITEDDRRRLLEESVARLEAGR